MKYAQPRIARTQLVGAMVSKLSAKPCHDCQDPN